ncbi:hypothetical protein GCM10027346_25230 [Hymenobacter seoulensis]
MKTKFITLLILLLAIFNINTVQAQSIKEKEPLIAYDLGKLVKVCYDVAGLGNLTSVDVTLTYDAYVYTQCTNPGDNIAPGQSKSYPSNSETITVPVRNGRIHGCVTSTKVFPAGDCPNSKWTGSVSDVTFTNVKLTVLGKSFTATNP